MADALIPVMARHLVDLFTGRLDAGQVRGSRNARFVLDADDLLVRPLAGRPARAICDAGKTRPERGQRLDALPQRLVHGRILGREEFEADVDIAREP